MNLKSILVYALTLTIVACSNSSNNNTNTFVADGLESVLVNRNWILNQYQGNDGNTLTFSGQSTSEFTIRFSSATDPSSVSGVNVCNGYQGSYSIEGSFLSLSNIIATEIACENSEEQPAALFERVLFSTNNTVVEYLDADRLEITSDMNEKLIFADEDSLRLTQLDGGDLASLCNNTFSEPRYQIIRDHQTLSDLYGSLHQSPCALDEPPQINFENTTVLFVAHELASSGGYSIIIANSKKTADRIIIEVQKTAPGENCAVTAALTAPYRLYSIAGFYENIEFRELPTLSPSCILR